MDGHMTTVAPADLPRLPLMPADISPNGKVVWHAVTALWRLERHAGWDVSPAALEILDDESWFELAAHAGVAVITPTQQAEIIAVVQAEADEQALLDEQREAVR